MARNQTAKLSDQLRKAIREAACTRYAISKATGIDQAVLSRFLAGERGMSLDSIDKLGEFLKLSLVDDKQPEDRGTQNRRRE